MNDTRPAGIGELLDRAVAMYVGSFVPIVAILAVAAVPEAMLNAFAGGWPRFSTDSAALQHTTDPVVRALLVHQVQGDGASAALVSVFTVALSVFASTAALLFIIARSDDAPIALGVAFRGSASRWLPEIGLVVLTVLAGTLVVVALSIAAAIVAVAFGLLVAAGLGVLRYIEGAAVVVFFMAALLAVVILSLAQQIAAVEVATGYRTPFGALDAALRALVRRRWWRSTLGVGGTLLAIGVLELLGALALDALVRGVGLPSAIGLVVEAAIALVVAGLVQCFIVVYARDVHDRLTGDDLMRAYAAGTIDGVAASAGAHERNDGLSAADRDVIARFLVRRGDLDADARATVAANIATRLRPLLAASFAHLDDESLLEHLGRP